MQARSTPMRRSPMLRGTKPLKRSPMVKRTPKKRAGHDKAMLDACESQKCFLQMPGCRSYEGDPTVVPAHRNQGKGMGLKVDDTLTVPACYHCHTAYDQGPINRTLKRARWDRAYVRWMEVRDAQESV